MKNSDWELFYNPFTRVAGWKAFFIGAAVVCLTVVLCWLTDIMAYGLEIKATPEYPLWKGFYYTGVGLACTVAIMYLAGIIFSKGVRFQDILGTVTLARAPYIFSPLLSLTVTDDFKAGIDAAVKSLDMAMIDWTMVVMMLLVAVVVSVWAVALLYNAFRVSTNIRGAKLTVLFIACLVLSEIVMIWILW